MPLPSTIGQRQQQLLRILLQHRQGCTVENLAQSLSISRNAVIQHIASLETRDYIESHSMTNTGGRPSKVYTLTQPGLELFPRHYDLISKLLVNLIRSRVGGDTLEEWFKDLGEQLARNFESQIDGNASREEKLAAVAAIMQELGYEARSEKGDHGPQIIATNCVFHKLAEQCHQVCSLDLSLISKLIGEPIKQLECIVKGGNCCRFSAEDANPIGS